MLLLDLFVKCLIWLFGLITLVAVSYFGFDSIRFLHPDHFRLQFTAFITFLPFLPRLIGSAE